MKSPIVINGRPVGPKEKCLIIAEAGVNHNGDRELAVRLIDAAADAGADAVKFQTFHSSLLVTPGTPTCLYQQNATGGQRSQLEMLRALELSEDDHWVLFEHCQKRQVIFLSTPFDENSVNFLHRLRVGAFKVPSGEITNLGYLRLVAEIGLPVLLSTGMSSLGEVEQAVETIEAAGNIQYLLLHCVSNYPADPADVNLRSMSTMATAFQAPVGYSDHTLGISVSLAAVAMGACVIEKHVTLDRSLPGPDHMASIEPGALRELVQGIRTVEMAMGRGRKSAAAGESETAALARKSLVASRDISAGDPLTDDVIRAMRPGTGISPALRPHVLNRVAKQDIPAGTLIQWEMLA